MFHVHAHSNSNNAGALLVVLPAHRCRFQVEMKMSEPLGTL